MILRRCDKCTEDFVPALDYSSIDIPTEVFSARGVSWRDNVKQYFGMKHKRIDLCPKCAHELEEMITTWLSAPSAENE